MRLSIGSAARRFFDTSEAQIAGVRLSPRHLEVDPTSGESFRRQASFPDCRLIRPKGPTARCSSRVMKPSSASWTAASTLDEWPPYPSVLPTSPGPVRPGQTGASRQRRRSAVTNPASESSHLPRWGSRVRIPSSAPGHRRFGAPRGPHRVTLRVTLAGGDHRPLYGYSVSGCQGAARRRRRATGRALDNLLALTLGDGLPLRRGIV